ncbi:DUF2690 domain-containing protein [Kitasatospora sp. NPDC002965]|uniref:DUF2690 domain-containing protein n=1 Tax=Kitasatospora sp. NPDC002965 TaxID=3154775 RepID=UPI0033ADA4B0
MPDTGVIGAGAEGDGAVPSARVELARTLRGWRTRAGELPQKTVARRLGVAQTTVSRYESSDGRYPAPEPAIRALWSCYRLAAEDLDAALALRARVDEELRSGTPGGVPEERVGPVRGPKVPLPVGSAGSGGPDGAVGVPAPVGAAPARDVRAGAVPGGTAPSDAPPADRPRHWVAWSAGAAAALAGVVAGGLLVHHLLGPAPSGPEDGARALPPAAASAAPGQAAPGRAASGPVTPPAQAPAVAGATATATCRADSCVHTEPNSTVCMNDAVTTAQGRDFGVHVELRYSPGCRAAWARISGSSPGDRVQVFGREGTPPDQEEYRQQTGRTAHTQMVRSAGPTDARACAIIDARGTVCAGEPPTPAPS